MPGTAASLLVAPALQAPCCHRAHRLFPSPEPVGKRANEKRKTTRRPTLGVCERKLVLKPWRTPWRTPSVLFASAEANAETNAQVQVLRASDARLDQLLCALAQHVAAARANATPEDRARLGAKLVPSMPR